MAEQNDDNNISFSDEESDKATESSVIAHKSMPTEHENVEKISAPPSPFPDEKVDENIEPVSPADEKLNENIEPISSDDDGDEANNKIDTGETNRSSFEAISDDEETNENSIASDKANNSSKVDAVEETGKQSVDNTTEKISAESPEISSPKDLDAPIPSPFSDIGDAENIIGTSEDNEMITSIMKDSQESDFNIASTQDSSESNTETPNLNSENLNQNVEIKTTESPVISVNPSETGESSSVKLDDSASSVPDPNSTVTNATKEGEEEKEDDEDDLIANIFGDSDDEEEEFEGFAEEEIGEDATPAASEQVEVDNEKDDSDDDDDRVPDRQEFISDFDIMMAQKKAQRSKRRKDNDYETLGDQDGLINDMIKDMHACAKEDRMLNQCGKAATKKLKMLPVVSSHLRKANLQSIFLESGVLSAIKDWLTPLPDNALPHVNIRKVFLRILFDMPPMSRMMLKQSGIGRAVMLLFKHPKELSANKKVAGKIISSWARPIFNVSTNMSELSREERESRDKATLPESKKRRLSSAGDSSKNRLDDDDENRPRKPGDKGWIGRARVPLPSHKDYINRPESKIEYEVNKAAKRELNRFEKQARKVKDRSGVSIGGRKAVGVSLNGTKLAL